MCSTAVDWDENSCWGTEHVSRASPSSISQGVRKEKLKSSKEQGRCKGVKAEFRGSKGKEELVQGSECGQRQTPEDSQSTMEDANSEDLGK